MKKEITCACLLGIALPSLSHAAPIPGDGLLGRYYQGYGITSGQIDFTGKTEAFTRVDPSIEFWNRNQNYRWEPVSGFGDNYGVEWTGFIRIDQTGRYGFGTISASSTRLTAQCRT